MGWGDVHYCFAMAIIVEIVIVHTFIFFILVEKYVGSYAPNKKNWATTTINW